MYVQKRDGRREEMALDKITRIKKLCYGLDKECVDPMAATLKVRRRCAPVAPQRALSLWH